MITAPYALRVLGVDNIGLYAFIGSFINYFVLFASLGLPSYGKRDGAIIRDDRERFSDFASEVLSLNIMLALVTYAVFFVFVYCTPRLNKDFFLVLILSTSIPFSALGVEWIYSVYEDYAYVTIRKLLTQIIALVLLFLFVRSRDDLISYGIVNMVANVGTDVWNLWHSKKFCDLRLVIKFDQWKHMIKSVPFFATSLMITIYVNTDQSIIGLICTDREVGLYSAAVKVYNVLNGFLTSASIVGVARLSNYVGMGRIQDYNRTASEIQEMCLTLLLPTVTGVCLFCREIILLIGGTEYLEAADSLFILSIAFLGLVPASFWGQCVLVANGKENILFMITTISAIVNLALNLVLIPYFKQDAAAFTTFLSESMTAMMSYAYGRKIVTLRSVKGIIVKCILGCVFIISVSLIFKTYISQQFVALLVSIVTGGIGYVGIEYALGNSVVTNALRSFHNKISIMFCNNDRS